MKKRLTWNKLGDVVAEFSQRERRIGYAADLILAEYSVPPSIVRQLARSWLIEELDRHQRPEAYANDDDEC